MNLRKLKEGARHIDQVTKERKGKILGIKYISTPCESAFYFVIN
jgi:hypothetical protein